MIRGDSCDDLGWVVIRIVDTEDDRTPDGEIGYLADINGVAPEGLDPSHPVRVDDAAAQFVLSWTDGATDEQEAVSFEISLSAVDLAGNMSEPSTPVVVSDPG